jgi:cytosine/adenosine deaminase-related metal-dependent hydrolase
MPASLIRSRALITEALDRHRWNEIADGAVLQEDGTVTAIGTYAELSRKHPNVPVIGTGNEIVLPGFVNGHHHVGLTPVQLGSPDMPLELWFVTRMVARNLNLYLDTLYSAFEMIASGVTTVQHIHGWMPGNLAEVDKGIDGLIRAYEDIGMRVSYSHLLETAYQKEYARRRGGCSAVEYIDRFGLLGPQMTLGHGVWLNQTDIGRLAETGTCICHNCSSNFRLRSGVAALNAFEAHGINTAIGMDEAGINDDRDMLQEMRMVLRVHRVPGMGGDVPTAAQVFRMATSGGARTTAFGESIGVLAPGKAADMVMIDWQQISYPYLDQETPLLDAVLQRAKTSGVRTVICDGEVIYRDGKFTKVDQDATLRALHQDLQKALNDSEVERRQLSKALLPHVKAFYADYIDPSQHQPFYKPSSRM